LPISRSSPEVIADAVPASREPRTFRGYIAELDGLRAIGISLVILNHMWPWEGYSRQLFLLLQLPWMLMDGFFVLSGWLITGILLDTRRRPDYFRSFYVRRALRSLPIYYAVLIFIVGIAVLQGHAAYRDMVAHWGSPYWFFVFLGNIPTAISGKWPLAGGEALVPLWSLQIEEQFYLLWPFLVRRMALGTLTRVLLGLCCGSTALRVVLYWLYPQNELVQCVLLPCHLEGLAMGSWLAIRYRQGEWQIDRRLLSVLVVVLGAVSLGSAAWSGYFNTTAFNRTIGYLIASIWFTCIILWLIEFRGSRQSAWLRQPVLRYMGKVSYAAYLFHWPVANVITSSLVVLGLKRFDEGLVRLVLIYGLTFGLSALSWHWFEKPLFRLKDRLFPEARLVRT
jgi:peptidoglycan/LPS O-acetylase OafA/YrhL